MKHPILSITWGFLLSVVGLCAAPSGSDLSEFASRTWQTDNGLPHNAVTAVLQTHDGYIWFGTWQGLGRFDGVHFTVFNPQNTPELKGPAIRALYETKDGTLWICTQDNGVTALSGGKFTHDPLGIKTLVKAMLQTSDGAIWFGTTNGLARFQNGACTWLTKTNGLLDNNVMALSEDHAGNLWIGTGIGVVRYDGQLREQYGASQLRVNTVRSLFCDEDGSVWIGTGGGGVSRLKDGLLQTFDKQTGLPDLFINFMVKDRRGDFRVGTLGGLARWTGTNFIAETNNEGTAYDFCLTEDREGSLWLGTKEGLTQLQPRPFRAITKQDGLSHNNVMAVLDDSHGTLWAATWGGGLDAIKRDGIAVYNHPRNGLYDLLLSVHEARDGSLWIGSEFDGGLYHFKDEQFIRFGINEGFRDPVVRVIHEQRDGTLWVGTSTALYQMRDGKFTRFTRADGLVGDTIRCLFEDNYGTLWIGTSDGLSRRIGDKFENLTMAEGLPDNQVLAMYQDRQRTLWVGTANGGLCRMIYGLDNSGHSESRPKFTSYTTRQGLFSNSVFEILEDNRGNLWMSCIAGIFRVSKKELDDFDRGVVHSISCASFGKIDGLASAQCNGVSKPSACKGLDGRLWFTTTRGLVVVDPNVVRENDPAPSVAIEEVIADNKLLLLGSKADSAYTSPSGELWQFRVEPGRGELEFNYTALGFRAAEKNRFKYKLEGVDNDWVDAGTRRTAHYNNIYPGEYVFRVIACNSDGVWNETGARVGLKVLPHFWQTAWFFGLCVLSGTGFVAGSVRYVTWKKVQRKLRRLEEQHVIERERTRIAQDMHDDLGARLTQILLLSNEAQKNKADPQQVELQVGKISHAAEEIIDTVHAIVWAVNPRNDSLDKLATYLYQQTQTFLESASIRCRFDVPDELPATPVSSEIRHNLFLVVKEALNNVVKHSRASEVWFRLKAEGPRLFVTIEDNGWGFDPEKASSLGNGLHNMRKRMQSIGGNCCLSSGTNGTRAQVELKIPNTAS